jgi:outer membrane protease
MRRLLSLLITVLILGSAAVCPASSEETKTPPENPWSVDVRVKRYFSSHTSYEFGNPESPFQAPLSRLEFPMNTLWGGAEVRRNFRRFSVGIEAMKNLSSESDGVFKDSDWEDGNRPEVKTVYSESNCRMENSYSFRADADMKVADWLRLPATFDLRPVVGFRWQRLAFMAHDGGQYAAGNNTLIADPLPGNGIQFDQTYWQYFIGVKAGYDLGKLLNLQRLLLQCQLDWAYVEGSNQDHHLLREGNRFTYESTTGDAWHASVGLKMGLTANINAGVELEYLKIRTTGTHRLVQDIGAFEESWDNGVSVWSEQISMMLNLEYRF